MFEIFSNPRTKKFHFRLKAKNGQIVLASQAYQTKQKCKAGIKSVARNAARGDRFHLHAAKNGKVYFTLNAANGEVIGTSQMYASPAGRKKGMESVQRNAHEAETVDLT